MSNCMVDKDKKLGYYRETARRAMLVNPCYVSRAMGVIKVSNCKNDFQSYSMTFDMLHTIFY